LLSILVNISIRDLRSYMPAVLSFDQAVTLPAVWITVHYCFCQAQLHSVQDTLVHAASGGVGLVSVEWAMRVRANTHATAGGVAKHALLRSCDVLRLCSISSSRNAIACAKLLSRQLRGRRIHSVVSALSNDFVSLSFAVLGSHGKLVENEPCSLPSCLFMRGAPCASHRCIPRDWQEWHLELWSLNRGAAIG
jgi:NADPH:quinone reductase-like Zn-dependent oxidoreductase